MPETFTPKTWVDGSAGGTPIIATELNRIETGIESMDDRVAALELLSVIDARAFGATFDGTTDDTTALQAFVTYLAVNGRRGVLPPGVARITSTLAISCRPGWEILGAGREATVIRQDTDNIPILNMGSDSASFMHSWAIRDLKLTYNNAQPSTNTSANCILMSQMAYQGEIRNVWFERGFYGIKVASGIGGPWGCSFDDLWFRSGLTGGAIDMSGATNRVPNDRYGRIYVECHNMIGPVFSLRGYNSIINTIEFNFANQSPVLMSFSSDSMFTIGALKLENYTYTTSRNLFDWTGAAYAQVGQIWIGGTTTATVNVPAGTLYLVNAGSGAGGGRVNIDYVECSAPVTLTAGSIYVMKGSSPTTIGKTSLGAGWNLQNHTSSAAAELVQVSDHINGHLSTDKGDSNYTVTLGDPNTVMFQTAFTAPRTVTLPSAGDTLFNGLYYDVVVDGAVNGTNTLTIQAGASTLRVQTADKTALRYTWRRNVANAALGWVLTSVRSLVGSLLDAQTFTGSGTWTKPLGATMVQISLIGGGSGGGSGRRGAAATARGGGGGGGGGGRLLVTVPASLLSATETVTIGGGGAGGAARTTDDTDGAVGVSGGATSFGSTKYRAGAGTFGGAGSTAGGAAGSAGAGNAIGTAGGVGGAAAAAGSGGSSAGAACGGGGGGGITTANTATASGTAFDPHTKTPYTSVAGGATEVSGTAGTDRSALHEAAGGGSGGGPGLAAAAGAGGAGGLYGGGGGGGGASLNGFNSGAGGAGANGYAEIISW